MIIDKFEIELDGTRSCRIAVVKAALYRFKVLSLPERHIKSTASVQSEAKCRQGTSFTTAVVCRDQDQRFVRRRYQIELRVPKNAVVAHLKPAKKHPTSSATRDQRSQ